LNTETMALPVCSLQQLLRVSPNEFQSCRLRNNPALIIINTQWTVS